jgi:hypothetical protein
VSEDTEHQYLSVNNWQKYQPKLKNGKPRRDWIRIDTNLEDDPAFMRLTFFVRSVLIGIWRLKGRTGNNPPNDPVYIARALSIEGESRHNMGRALGELVVSGFLVLSNQQIEVESALQDRTGQDKTIQEKEQKHVPKEPAPASFGHLNGFSSFWTAYPKKKAKGDALKAWNKIRPSEELKARILAAVETQKQSHDWKKNNGQYIPYPASWLNAGQWDDQDQPEQGEPDYYEPPF